VKPITLALKLLDMPHHNGGITMTFFSKFAAITAIALSAQANAGSIYFFGDSLSDTGNVSLATGGAFPDPNLPYAPGQYTDKYGGGVWTAQFASLLNQPKATSAPSLAGGNNYAWAGATTGPGNVPGLGGQVATYLSPAGPAGSSQASDLFAIVIGGNDLRAALVAAAQPGANAQAIFGAAIANGMTIIDKAVRDLYNDQARHFLIANMPDVSKAPETKTNGAGAVGGALLFEQLWNQAFASEILSLSQLNGIDVDVLDLFGLAQRSNAFFAQAGITELNTPCFAAANPAAACPSAFFSDTLHPSSAAHRLIALEAISAIPLPGSLALLMFGLSGLLIGLRKRLV
jgi:outer membrane lipase/esterase